MACPFQRRTILLCSVLVIGLSALSVRLIQLQVIERHSNQSSGESPQALKIVLPAERGLLVDRNEKIIAANLLQADVYVDRHQFDDPVLAALCLAYDRASWEQDRQARIARASGEALPDWDRLGPEAQAKRVLGERRRILDELEPQQIVGYARDYTISKLAKPFALSPPEMREMLEDPERMDVLLRKDLAGDIASWIEQMVDEHWIQGFRFERSFRRWYPMPEMASHVIGFADDTYVGKCGVEAALESYLGGRDGERVLERDSRGMLMPAHAGHLMEPRLGLNVQLTLDMEIQAIVEEELDRGLEEFIADTGTAIVMEPRSGKILAMASRPQYNLNRRDRIREASLNFATQAIYEPGSTFKIIAVSGALDAGIVGPTTEIFCHNGHYHKGVVSIPDHHSYGMLTVEGVVQKSSNIGAYQLALKLGRRGFYDMAERYGFGRKTGIRLAGESGGVLRDSGNPVDFSRVAYGYAASVTPLQVACAFSAVANGGRLMQPRIATRVVSSEGRVIERFGPKMVGRVMKDITSARMRKALEMVVDEKGTARRAKVPGYRVGGKTGTARKHNPHGPGYLVGKYTVSFAGMLPIEHPEFVCVVVVDDPRTDPDEIPRYGGTIAAPIFARIAERTAIALNLPPSEPEEAEETIAVASP